MKKLYSLFALIALLFTASGCEDDYRSMVLFEGVEPIYQIGTCDNLVSNLSYYLSETNEVYFVTHSSPVIGIGDPV